MYTKDLQCIITHSVMYADGQAIHGPAHAVGKALSGRGGLFLIEHPLNDGYPSFITHTRKSVFIAGKKVGVIRWIVELFYNVRWLFANKPSLVIAIDPLNAFSCVLLRALGFSFRFIYYTVDFSTKRSENSIINSFYLFLDFLAAGSADRCWAVSKRILHYRNEVQKIDESKLFLLPNTPVSSPRPQMKTAKNKKNLVIVSNIHKGIGFEEVFQAFFSLAQVDAEVELTVIGDGEKKEYFQKLCQQKGFSSRVHFLGRLSHEKVQKKLLASGVGLALYTGYDSHRYYSDSMKARDYLSVGLPVIISGDLGTAEDIAKFGAGEWIDLSSEQIIKSVRKITSSDLTYSRYATHAFQLAKEHAFQALFAKAMEGYDS